MIKKNCKCFKDINWKFPTIISIIFEIQRVVIYASKVTGNSDVFEVAGLKTRSAVFVPRGKKQNKGRDLVCRAG